MGWGQFALPLALSMVIAGLTAVMLALLAPIFTGLTTGNFASTFSVPGIGPVLEKASGFLSAESGVSNALLILIFLMAGSGLLAFALSFLLGLYTAHKRALFSEKLSNRLFKTVLTQDQRFFDKYGQGHLTELLHSSRHIHNLFDIGQNQVSAVTQLLGRLIVMATLSVPATLLLLAIVPPFALAARMIRIGLRKSAEKGWKTQLDQSKDISSALSAFDLVKGQNGESVFLERFASKAYALRRFEARARTLAASVGPIQDAIGLIALTVTLLLVARYIGFADKERLVSIGVLFFVARSTLPMFSRISNNRVQFATLAPLILATTDLLDSAPLADGKKEFPDLKEGIRLQNVSLAHPGGRSLKDISLHIARGEHVQLVGESGSGKTTLLKLLLGLFKPDSGQIFYDGVDIGEFKISSLRKRVGYVNQEALLYNDTIRANLLFGHSFPVSDSQMLDALTAVGLQESCGDLNATVGDRGTTLSGGERQRLSLARALLRNPDILLLDEPTNALDSETASLVLEVLRKLPAQTTVIIVAHDEKLNSFADRSLELEKGTLISATESSGVSKKHEVKFRATR